MGTSGPTRSVAPSGNQVTYFALLMNREYHKGYSHELHRDMEVLIFGHSGTPLLVFPTSRAGSSNMKTRT